LVDGEFPSEGAKVAFSTSIADKEQFEWFAALEQWSDEKKQQQKLLPVSLMVGPFEFSGAQIFSMPFAEQLAKDV
jgi:hypothetical protein